MPYPIFHNASSEIENKHRDMYNNDLNGFHEPGIKNAVSNHIRENGFRLPEDDNKTYPNIPGKFVMN